MSDDATSTDPWAAVVGQDEIVDRLRRTAVAPTHAYLFVGQAGYGTRAAARAFAAELLVQSSSPEETQRHRRLAVAEQHPAITVIERVGPSISADQAREISRQANMSPAEGTRQILVLTDFHLVTTAAAMLLKSIEEPPSGTIFVILADDVPPDLVTIASRCARFEFGPVATSVIRERLDLDGIDAEVAAAAAASSGGDLDRARLLAVDERLVERRDFWMGVPERLDGTGATAAALATEALARIDEVLAPLRRAHEAELGALLAEVDKWGLTMGPVKALEDRHKREQRRIRTAEYRAGLAALAGRYRDAVSGHDSSRGDRDAFVTVGDLVTRSCEQLAFNPNLDLLLQALMVSLPILESAPAH